MIRRVDLVWGHLVSPSADEDTLLRTLRMVKRLFAQLVKKVEVHARWDNPPRHPSPLAPGRCPGVAVFPRFRLGAKRYRRCARRGAADPAFDGADLTITN